MKAPMRVWMEITNRDYETLGTTLEVRRYLDSGQLRLSSILLEQVRPGDIVFHWWRGENPPVLLGWSVITGHPSVYEAEELFVDDFDIEAAEAIQTSKSTLFSKAVSPRARKAHIENTWTEVPLNSMYELHKPVTLPMIKQLAPQIFALEQQLHESQTGPLHFPFTGSLDKGIHGACSRYLARFPVELLDILPGRPPTVAELTDIASKTLRILNVDRHYNPAVQAALDQHAIDAATSLLVDLNYTVIDVSGFRDYQLRAIRDGELPLHIRVVAAKADVETVPATEALVVVDRIRVLDDAFPPITGRQARGGRLRWWPKGTCEGAATPPEGEYPVTEEWQHDD
ncbi:hypothetical protein [Rhodococcus chondri]|uniref:EVE domain-containing protein n=1 Tax=Rhodococcus chondri TaxID=3065941 RepID=A0ABU7JW36_9NOCA|nr:hypothetical protein [Rhodococcus sp. CC-R104]MEE2033982.1 hypothetical protein [Rhodococcus sp. CC-R104]